MTIDIAPWSGPVAVTLVYVLVYYGFMIRQARVKFALTAAYRARGEKFDRYFGNDREMLAADRVMLNMHEHMAPFLVLLWLHAAFVGTTGATVAGAIYVGARLAYPLLLGNRLGRGIPMRIVAATGTGYLVLGYFVAALGAALLL
ncbi:MAG: MAPEG family protein [Myxococcota bacterium]